MDGVSRSEQYTAIAVGIGTYFLFYYFHLIPSSYEEGRLAAVAAVALGAGAVILIWSFIVKKKRDASDDHS
jgi:Na+-transporting NADH:ubiquinone oxidoreductase subunit NqrB